MKIVIAGQLSRRAMVALHAHHKVTYFETGYPDGGSLAEADVLVTRGHLRVTAELLHQAPRVKLLVKAGSGTDNIDLPETKRRGIKVVTTPASTQAVAELTFALLLAVKRNICFMNDQVRQGKWEAKYKFPGHTLADSILGIIGFGYIGRRVAQLGRAFGMDLLVYDRSPETPAKQAVAMETNATFTKLSTLLAQSDAITVHVPLLPETRNLIGQVELGLVRPGSVLINTARAAVVDKQALIQALKEQRLSGAGLDVFHDEPIDPEDPLLACPQVVCTPHIGAQTFETMEAIGARVVETVEKFVPQAEGHQNGVA